MRDDGGPAFPRQPGTDGMTLRDYFAAKAMASIGGRYGFIERDRVAKEAYEMADAMLAARENARRV